MLCQNCGKNEATTHVKRIIHGSASEYHLCQRCASKLGYGDIFSGFDDFGFGGLFGNLFSQGQSLLGDTSASALRCEKCGSTFRDIAETGKVGCADCYRIFKDRLMPSLQRIHGRTKHIGKSPAGVVPGPEKQIEDLKGKLQKAIETQNFEEAAKLRDQIKSMEQEG